MSKGKSITLVNERLVVVLVYFTEADVRFKSSLAFRGLRSSAIFGHDYSHVVVVIFTLRLNSDHYSARA